MEKPNGTIFVDRDGEGHFDADLDNKKGLLSRYDELLRKEKEMPGALNLLIASSKLDFQDAQTGKTQPSVFSLVSFLRKLDDDTFNFIESSRPDDELLKIARKER